MSDTDDSHWESKWAYRLAGVGVVVGIVWGFLKSDGDILEALASGFIGALGFGLLGMPISFAISRALKETNPFKQGLSFAVGIMVGFAILDLVVLGGMLIIQPFVYSLLGMWEETFWGCPGTWECVDDGHKR